MLLWDLTLFSSKNKCHFASCGFEERPVCPSEASDLQVEQGKCPAIHTKIQINAHSSTAVRTYQVIQLQHDFDYTHFRENTSRLISTPGSTRSIFFPSKICCDFCRVEYSVIQKSSPNCRSCGRNTADDINSQSMIRKHENGQVAYESIKDVSKAQRNLPVVRDSAKGCIESEPTASLTGQGVSQ